MRINVYSQELTSEVKLVSKETDTGIVYYGVRLYFASPAILHNTEEDDDRSAITFWIPHCESFTAADLASVLHEASQLVANAPK